MCKKYLILLLPLFFSSCTLAGKLIFGASNLKPVSVEKIRKSGTKYGIDSCYIYTIRQNQYLKYFSKQSTFPYNLVYDKAGHLLQLEPNSGCHSSERLINRLRPDSTFSFVNDSSFYQFPTLLEGLHHEPFNIESLPDADFYVFIFSGTFAGRLNKSYFNSWLGEIEKNKKARIQVIYISLDMRKDWDIDALERQFEEIASSKK